MLTDELSLASAAGDFSLGEHELWEEGTLVGADGKPHRCTPKLFLLSSSEPSEVDALSPGREPPSTSLPIPIRSAEEQQRRDSTCCASRVRQCHVGVCLCAFECVCAGPMQRLSATELAHVARSLPTPQRLRRKSPPPVPHLRPSLPPLTPPRILLPPASPRPTTPGADVSLITQASETSPRAVEAHLATSCPARFYSTGVALRRPPSHSASSRQRI